MAMIRWGALLFAFSSLIHASTHDSFREILSDMLQRDPDFKNVDFQTEVFQAQYRRDATRLVLPSISFTAGKLEHHNTSSPPIVDNKYNTAGVEAAFDVFSFGHDWNMYQSSQLERQAQDQRVITKVMERELELGRLLLTYMREARNLRILVNIVELKEKALKISQERFRNGGLSEQDMNKIRLDVSNAKAEYLITTQAFNTIKASLSGLGVETPPENFPWEHGLSSERLNEIASIQSPVEGLPQFLEADFQSKANERRNDALFGRMLGKVQLTFARNYYDYAGEDQWEWRTGLLYTVPLFDRFGQYTDYQEAKARWRTSETLLRYRKKVTEKVQVAEDKNLKISYENFTERKEALKISGNLYNDSVRQFNRGQLSVNELLVDQDRLLRTEQIANQSIYQMHLSLMSFCHSRGRPIIKACF